MSSVVKKFRINNGTNDVVDLLDFVDQVGFDGLIDNLNYDAESNQLLAAVMPKIFEGN